MGRNTHQKVTTFKERFCDLLDEHPSSGSEIARHLGISKQAVSTWRTGEHAPKAPAIETIARFFGVSVDWLMGFDVERGETVSVSNIIPIRKQAIPLIGAIHAGEPSYADEDFESYIEVGSNVCCDFALRVVGDSMVNIRVQDGDIVFIRKQDTVNDGEIAAVLIDDDAALKRVRFLPNRAIMLQAENSKYPPIYVGGENETRNIRIIGKAVAFQSDIR